MIAKRSLLVSLGFAAVTALASGACSATPSNGDRFNISGPSSADSNFGPVDLVFEKRCGSLDCHGQYGRPLRIYSANGLRKPNDAGLGPGAGATTHDEVSDNYRSITALEAERMTQVVTQSGDPLSLLILAKPLNLQSHKGGQVIIKDDPAYTCIFTWIKDPTPDLGKCAQAAVFPQP